MAARPHGETGRIVELFTESRGRWAGLVRGGAGRRLSSALQPGAQLSVMWRGRLESHLGQFAVEPVRTRLGLVHDDPDALAALSAVAALLAAYTPERAPMPALYGPTLALLDALGDPAVWPTVYAHWELLLLEQLGYGLDLSRCAATGATQELVYVSPRSGRAVSRGAGAPYHDRLLPLPAFLRLGEACDPRSFDAALTLTGHFLTSRVAAAHDAPDPPPARKRLADRARKAAAAADR